MNEDQQAIALDELALQDLVAEMTKMKDGPIKKNPPPEELTEDSDPKLLIATIDRLRDRLYRMGLARREIQLNFEQQVKIADKLRHELNMAQQTALPKAAKLRKIVNAALAAFSLGCVPRGSDRRMRVWEKYCFTFINGAEAVVCFHCGKVLSFADFTVEHLKPKILGGTDDMENLRPSCGPCNWYRPVEDISQKEKESNDPEVPSHS